MEAGVLVCFESDIEMFTRPSHPPGASFLIEFFTRFVGVLNIRKPLIKRIIKNGMICEKVE